MVILIPILKRPVGSIRMAVEQVCPLLSGSTYRSESDARPSNSAQHSHLLAPEGDKLVLGWLRDG